MNCKFMVAIVILIAVSIVQPEQQNQSQQTSICTDAEYRQFDFWIGEWDVNYRTNGKKAGTSKIESILDGCVILENWTGVDGYTGKSFNLYDRTTKKWIQKWVDSQGQLIEFQGSHRNRMMEFHGEGLNPNGEPVQLKMSFTQLEDGKVRQLWEQSKDHGKTWLSLFDGIYAKKASM